MCIRDRSSRLSIQFEELERFCDKTDHLNDGLVDGCFHFAEECLGISSAFSALGKECKELSNNCITLGLKKSNLKLREYAAKSEELKDDLIKVDSYRKTILLKLT